MLSCDRELSTFEVRCKTDTTLVQRHDTDVEKTL